MRILKKAKKSIALLLITAMTVVQFNGISFALEDKESELNSDTKNELNNDAEYYVNENLQITGNYQNGNTDGNEYDNIRDEFKSKFGNENKFQLVAKSKDFKTEGNGYTGELRITTYDANGDIENVSIINYLDNLEKCSKESDSEDYNDNDSDNDSDNDNVPKVRAKRSTEKYVFKTIRTGGNDPFSMYVKRGGKYKSKYKIHATGRNGYNKSKYKKTSKTWYKDNWRSGNTEGLYHAIKDGKNAVQNAQASLVPGVTMEAIIAATLSSSATLAVIPPLSAIVAAVSLYATVKPVYTVAKYTQNYFQAVEKACYHFAKI